MCTSLYAHFSNYKMNVDWDLILSIASIGGIDLMNGICFFSGCSIVVCFLFDVFSISFRSYYDT